MEPTSFSASTRGCSAVEIGARGLFGTIGAIVVTLHSQDACESLVGALRGQVDFVVVVDNGSGAAMVASLRQLEARHTGFVQLVLNDQNVGLARGQNQGIDEAIARGADWIILFDQDSRPSRNLIEAMALAIQSEGAPDRIGIVAASIQRTGSTQPQGYLLADHRWRWRPVSFDDRPTLKPLAFAIAAGSLIRVDAIKQIGPMREEFFIDYVDIEFCLRLNCSGFRIVAVRGAQIIQPVGETREYRFLRWRVRTTHHAVSRRYLMYRNRVRLWLAYGRSCPGWLIFDVTAAFSHLLRIMIFEDCKRAKLGASLKGLARGFAMGPARPSTALPCGD